VKQADQYKMLPNSKQRQAIDKWLEMIRYQYNYLLADRFNWWQYNRSDCVIPQGEFCQIACSIGSQVLRDNPNYHSQSATLPNLKEHRPWYKNIYSQVLQDAVKRVDKAMMRYVKGDSKQKRSGKPRSKKIDGKYVENGQARKSLLNKSFADCAISQFVEILQHQCQKVGGKVIKVNPKNSSQYCWKCLNKVPKSLSDRWHNCDKCNESIDRDENSALLLKKVGLGIVSL
jgi:transposase